MAANEITAKAQILVRRPRQEVFDAFVDPRIMSKFWFTRRDQGLRVGETVAWYVGDAPDAFEIAVRVTSIEPPAHLAIEWGHGDQFTTVDWTLAEQGREMTRLVIEERGFTGSQEEVVSQALDSTGGFNQVAVAVKALLEHRATINIVADHVS